MSTWTSNRTCSLAILLLALPFSTTRADDTDKTAAQGRTLYTTNQCWQCHGYQGQGGAAERIAPTPYSFEIFARFVRRPNVMPAYSPNVLSDEDLKKIYDYIKTIPEPPKRDELSF